MISAIHVFCYSISLHRQIKNTLKNQSKMKGVIYHANAARGMYSARLADGSFTVFELVDPIELPRNIEVNGEFEEYGDREIFINKEERLHVHIDNYGLNEIVAFKKTFLIV